jgi:hypothetical protein
LLSNNRTFSIKNRKFFLVIHLKNLYFVNENLEILLRTCYGVDNPDQNLLMFFLIFLKMKLIMLKNQIALLNNHVNYNNFLHYEDIEKHDQFKNYRDDLSFE